MIRGKVLALTAFVLVALAIGAACGDDDSGGTATSTASSGATATAGAAFDVQPGDGGVASNPRAVADLSQWKLDDGLAMFDSRPADEDRTGVTDTSIKICRPAAETGPAASFGQAFQLQQELINRINAAGGINGRTIDLVTRDTKGDSPTAVQIVKEFVEQDDCFAIWGASDSQVFESYYDYLAENKVPALYSVVTNTFVAEPGNPYWITGTSSTQAIQRIWGKWVFENNPGIKIGLLYENDSYGQAGLAGWKAAAEESGGELVATVAFTPAAPDLNGEIQQIVDAGATGFVGIGYPTDWPKFVGSLRESAGSDIPMFDPGGLSVLGITPDSNLFQYLDGIVSHTFGPLQPGDPGQGITDSVALMQSLNIYPISFTVAFGQILTEYLARSLECAGPDLTRQGVMLAINGGCFNESYTCTVCSGPAIITPDDRWPQETIYVQQWDGANGVWKRISDPISFETSDGDGLRGNFDDLQCSDELPCPWKDGCTSTSAGRCAWKDADTWTLGG